MSPSDSPTLAAPRRQAAGRLAWWWWLGGAALVLAVVLSFANASFSVSGDPRLARPIPIPRPAEPFLGVGNWPAFFSIAFVVVAAAILGRFGWLSWRNRQLHRVFVVMLAVTMLSVLDPPANWVTFTVFDPRFLHFDTTWFWIDLAPLVEPLPNVAGYPFYFGLGGIIAAWIARRFLGSERGRRGWPARHPLLAAFAICFAFGILWDVPTELFMIRARMYFYSEFWGPAIHWGNATYPVVWGLFTWLPVGLTGLMLIPDDRGRSRVLASLSARMRRPGTREVSAGREILAGFVVLLASYILCLGIYGSLRVSELSEPSGEPWPFTESKVYDPYGHWNQRGLPGPYYE